ncbi:MAG TPA: Grx4 family monothiol glutaredoxin [Gemmatimonadota bacterium]|nr:Grx4 family monothiol glutaredoxin [Gemmatimonadota bacterium]
MTPEMKERIERDVRSRPVLIYMKGTADLPRCGFSARAVEVLRRSGAEGKIHSVDVLADPELWEAVKEYSDWPTIPQVYVGGEFIGGSDIALEMYESGELQPKVVSALMAGEDPDDGYLHEDGGTEHEV